MFVGEKNREAFFFCSSRVKKRRGIAGCDAELLENGVSDWRPGRNLRR